LTPGIPRDEVEFELVPSFETLAPAQPLAWQVSELNCGQCQPLFTSKKKRHDFAALTLMVSMLLYSDTPAAITYAHRNPSFFKASTVFNLIQASQRSPKFGLQHHLARLSKWEADEAAIDLCYAQGTVGLYKDREGRN
jgi:hypothetical protein